VRFSVVVLVLATLVSACSPGGTPAAPVAWIDKPLDGSSHPLGPIDVMAHASDLAGVSQLRLEANGEDIGSAFPDNPEQALVNVKFDWSPPSAGEYKLQVFARSSQGPWGESAQATISITAALAALPTLTECTFTAAAATTIYQRPSLSADLFFEATAGFAANPQAQTADGWLGFDPAIAQAANTGPFRLRWIPPGSADLSGDCDHLPTVWGPPAGLCFLMPMAATDVHDQPDAGSPLVTRLTPDNYAAVDGINRDNWIHVDLGPGNTGFNNSGWVGPDDVNFNGPCDLPLSATPAPTVSAPSVLPLPPSSNQAYYGIGGCTPTKITFNAETPNPRSVKAIVFFYYLQDEESGARTEWSSGQAMPSQGNGRYALELTASQLIGGSGFVKATVHYQLALQSQQGEIVRSQVQADVVLARCGIIILPPVIILTPVPPTEVVH
jgi:hypothetical protein